MAEAVGESRKPKSEIRRKSEDRNPKAERQGQYTHGSRGPEVWEYPEYWDLYARKADLFATRPSGQRNNASAPVTRPKAST